MLGVVREVALFAIFHEHGQTKITSFFILSALFSPLLISLTAIQIKEK
jgi:hypothetical protein